MGLDKGYLNCYNICIAEKNFCKCSKKSLDKIKNKCYNICIVKQKKYFAKLGKSGLTK